MLSVPSRAGETEGERTREPGVEDATDSARGNTVELADTGFMLQCLPRPLRSILHFVPEKYGGMFAGDGGDAPVHQYLTSLALEAADCALEMQGHAQPVEAHWCATLRAESATDARDALARELAARVSSTRLLAGVMHADCPLESVELECSVYPPSPGHGIVEYPLREIGPRDTRWRLDPRARYAPALRIEAKTALVFAVEADEADGHAILPRVAREPARESLAWRTHFGSADQRARHALSIWESHDTVADAVRRIRGHVYGMLLGSLRSWHRAAASESMRAAAARTPWCPDVFLLGVALHTTQDSFSASHVTRGPEPWCPIRMVHAIPRENAAIRESALRLHAQADRDPRAAAVPCTRACATVLALWMSGARRLARSGGDATALPKSWHRRVRAIIAERVLPLDPAEASVPAGAPWGISLAPGAGGDE